DLLLTSSTGGGLSQSNRRRREGEKTPVTIAGAGGYNTFSPSPLLPLSSWQAAVGRRDHTATVNAAVSPPETLPLIVASSSAEPSLKTLSLASVTRERLVTLASYPDVA